jgi:formylglycine-generating enzyme required for sulfatase activity
MKKRIKAILLSVMIIFLISCGKKTVQPVLDLTTRSGIEMVYLPGGEFIMGESSSAHKVKLSPFYLDNYEVTQTMFKKLGLTDPSHFKGENRPVEMTTYTSAAIYCNERSLEEGLTPCYDQKTWECNFNANGYRLPTEAEWEYAARAGTSGKYYFGTDSKNLKEHAVFKTNSSGHTADVGSKKPNPWGLYDMYGNVAEWCHDYYALDYYKTSDYDNPKGPSKGETKVLRGGSWKDPEEKIGSYIRATGMLINGGCALFDTSGFRCVRKAQ